MLQTWRKRGRVWRECGDSSTQLTRAIFTRRFYIIILLWRYSYRYIESELLYWNVTRLDYTCHTRATPLLQTSPKYWRYIIVFVYSKTPNQHSTQSLNLKLFYEDIESVPLTKHIINNAIIHILYSNVKTTELMYLTPLFVYIESAPYRPGAYSYLYSFYFKKH